MANIKVKVEPSSQIRVASPLSLTTTVGAGSTQYNRLDSLLDVEEVSPQDGAFLVYRASDDKYVVTSNVSLNLSNSTGTLDGGSF